MIDKLERKFGKYAIKNLMKYIVILYILGFVVYQVEAIKGTVIYWRYLVFDIDKILHGQVWRIVTFLIQPIDDNLLFLLISLWFYYFIGSSLERIWGSFRFNLFYISGVLFNILASVIYYVIVLIITHGQIHFTYPISLHYINLSMVLAFAAIISEMQVLLFFVLPIKIKYLAYLYLGIEGYLLVKTFINSGWILGLGSTIIVVVSLLNFIIFFLNHRRKAGHTFANYKRRTEYQNSYNRGANSGYATNVNVGENGRARAVITRHKCAVCGQTELDDDSLEFRFCSKCDGNYEYCSKHLYTHTHVIREYKDN